MNTKELFNRAAILHADDEPIANAFQSDQQRKAFFARQGSSGGKKQASTPTGPAANSVGNGQYVTPPGMVDQGQGPHPINTFNEKEWRNYVQSITDPLDPRLGLTPEEYDKRVQLMTNPTPGSSGVGRWHEAQAEAAASGADPYQIWADKENQWVSDSGATMIGGAYTAEYMKTLEATYPGYYTKLMGNRAALPRLAAANMRHSEREDHGANDGLRLIRNAVRVAGDLIANAGIQRQVVLTPEQKRAIWAKGYTPKKTRTGEAGNRKDTGPAPAPRTGGTESGGSQRNQKIPATDPNRNTGPGGAHDNTGSGQALPGPSNPTPPNNSWRFYQDPKTGNMIQIPLGYTIRDGALISEKDNARIEEMMGIIADKTKPVEKEESQTVVVPTPEPAPVVTKPVVQEEPQIVTTPVVEQPPVVVKPPVVTPPTTPVVLPTPEPVETILVPPTEGVEPGPVTDPSPIWSIPGNDVNPVLPDRKKRGTAVAEKTMRAIRQNTQRITPAVLKKISSNYLG